MKKSLLALAVLGAFAGVASAQSSVTLFGTLDVNGTLRQERRPGPVAGRMSHGRHQQQPARLPRRRRPRRRPRPASTCIAGVNADTGSAAPTRKFWNRRSTVSLFSNAGELRLGRDYTPTFWNLTIFDAFGTNGLGSSTQRPPGCTAVPVRTTRSATSCREPGRLLRPGHGRRSAKAAPRLTAPARYLGGRFGFAAGPFDIAGAYGGNRRTAASPFACLEPAPAAVTRVIPAGDDAEDLERRRLVGLRLHEADGLLRRGQVRPAKEKMCLGQRLIPFGQAEVHVGYDLQRS